MGIVYAVEHTLLKSPAAVKVLLPKLSSKQEIVTRFFNEARAATAIRHPGIVEVYDFGWTSDGSAFIVMEHLQGETLRARRKRASMQWSHALALVRQVAGALAAAHAKGIVHRDLKPDNIFLVSDPEVPGGKRIKLLDFGIAKLAGALPSHIKTKTGALMGTPTYMAPEQCRGVTVDWRADLYALGCILFELCTGRPPFVAQNTADLLAAHIQKRPPTIASLASDVPQEIETLVQRMLAKAPAERVQTAEELIRLIDATRTAIGPLASSGSHPILAPVTSLDEHGSKSDRSNSRGVAPTESPEDEGGARTELQDVGSATTFSERSPAPAPRREAVEPAPPLQEVPTTAPPGSALPATVLTHSAVPTRVRPHSALPTTVPPDSTTVIPPPLDTTRSPAVGTRQRASTQVSARRIALLGGVAGAIAIAIVIVRSAGGGDASTEIAAPPAEAGAPRSTDTATQSSGGRDDTAGAEPPERAASPPSLPPPPVQAPAAPSTDAASSPTSPSSGSSGTAHPTESIGAKGNGDTAVARAPKQLQPATTQVTIDSTPRRATIRLGDEVLGETPWFGPIPRSAGTVKLELRLDGYQKHELVIPANKSNAYNASLLLLPPSQPENSPPES
jgi:serine/threonine-protein kinase